MCRIPVCRHQQQLFVSSYYDNFTHTSVVSYFTSLHSSHLKSIYCIQYTNDVQIERGGSVVTHETPIRESRVQIPWPANLVEVFSDFLNLKITLLILQHFRHFTYVTARSPTLLSLFLRHRLFTFVTWRAAHVMNIVLSFFVLAQGKYLRPFLYVQWHSRKQQILPQPPTPFKYFHGKILLTRQTD